jgi:hypothetical protein
MWSSMSHQQFSTLRAAYRAHSTYRAWAMPISTMTEDRPVGGLVHAFHGRPFRPLRGNKFSDGGPTVRRVLVARNLAASPATATCSRLYRRRKIPCSEWISTLTRPTISPDLPNLALTRRLTLRALKHLIVVQNVFSPTSIFERVSLQKGKHCHI